MPAPLLVSEPEPEMSPEIVVSPAPPIISEFPVQESSTVPVMVKVWPAVATSSSLLPNQTLNPLATVVLGPEYESLPSP